MTESFESGGAGIRISDLTFGYGPVPTVKNVNLHVAQGEMVALLGGNGAGKSTVLKLVAGLMNPWSGRIEAFGTVLRNEPPHLRARRGLRLMMQGHPVFGSLTVAENLQLAKDLAPRGRAEAGGKPLSVDDMLDLFPRLRERGRVLGSSLSGGERAMLGVAQPLISGAAVLLLDEPSAGLAPSTMIDFFEDLKRISAEIGTTMLIVEQNAFAVLPLCHRAYVMNGGQVVLDSTPEALMADEKLVQTYLAY